MRIVSLLPSATEIVYALGLEDDLVGVTFECDFPPAARAKPVVSGTALSTDGTRSARDIDEAVASMVGAGEPIYTLDTALVADLRPDLILAQDLCRVCAVPSGAVDDALDVMGCRADVLSLDPTSLDEVIGCIGAVGDATATAPRARALMDALRERVEAVRSRVDSAPRPRTFALEWADPPFNAGHWVPDMIEAAGGEPVLGEPRRPSRRVTWDEIEQSHPDVVVFMPCGFDLAGAIEQGRGLPSVPQLHGVHDLYATDANALFSRPGPRIVDGVEQLAALLHPDRVTVDTMLIAPLRASVGG